MRPAPNLSDFPMHAFGWDVCGSQSVQWIGCITDFDEFVREKGIGMMNSPTKLKGCIWLSIVLVCAGSWMIQASDGESTMTSSGLSSRVTVALVFLEEPSGMNTTDDLGSLGPVIVNPSLLIPVRKVYLEAWCQTPGSSGITSAVIDLSYDTGFLDTSVNQVSLASQWGLLSFPISTNEEAGHIDNLGGNNLSGLGVAPDWARIGTVEFDVTADPVSPVEFCSLFAGISDGGGQLEFVILFEGAVDPVDVDYKCVCAADVSIRKDFGHFVTCMTGPDRIAGEGCECIDFNQDAHIDLADFASIQLAFAENP